MVGIVVNLMLAAFKAAVGLLSNSIAVVLDAVNNLSDALSSIITIIGAKVAGKPAAAVAVCRRGGATAAFQTLQMPFQMVNMPLVTSQYWNIAYGLEPGDIAQDAEGLQTMRTMARNMAWMVKQFKSGTAQSPEYEPWQGTNFIR